MNKIKSAVVYDRWLHSLGGGEVVAANIAKILKSIGYSVLFISGKEVSKEIIFDKFQIDLTGIKFEQVWNDETVLKKLVKGKDLFINISFMDYSRGFAKNNIYYANFPTKPYDTIKGMLFSKIIAPLATRFIKPIESMNIIDAPIVMKDYPAYILSRRNKYALTNLEVNNSNEIEFNLFIENLDKSILENIKVDFENGQILNRSVRIDHYNNLLKYNLKFLPKSNTVYLNLNITKPSNKDFDMDEGKIYLLYPKIKLKKISNIYFNNFTDRVLDRLRAGIYVNTLDRLDSYNYVLTYSTFAKKWIRNYWKRDAVVISPPVEMFFRKYDINKIKKNNWICSVGRFFTLGHGKKQEILIEAFKKLNDKFEQKWELHLVGGLGSEPSSIDFFKYLKEKSKGYPIFFHINASRQEVENIYLKSKIYWHATGVGEDENYQPIRFEHFGISPVEALSAGCIPILFKGGALPELIRVTGLSKDKNLFVSVDDLVEKTLYYQKERNRNVNWKSVFNSIEVNYSEKAFKDKFIRLLASLIK